MRIRTFKGFVPAVNHVSEVASVPYNVVNRQEALALVSDKPLSMLHVDRAEIGLAEEVGPYSAAVYTKARENFERLQAHGGLVRENKPTMYLYRQQIGGHCQTGLVTLCHTQDYEKGIIKKHSKTQQVEEDDRTQLLDRLDANISPVTLAYRQRAGISALIDGFIRSEKPINDFTAVDGVRHQVWRLSLSLCVSLTSLFDSQVTSAYVTDGHHRAMSALRVSHLRRKANPKHDGSEDYNWFLCALFPADELKILPYNRAVKDLNGFTREQFIQKVEEIFVVKETMLKSPFRPRQCCMYLADQWFELTWQPAKNASIISDLDISVLQNRLLKPILGIDDPRTSKRIDFIPGSRGNSELEKLVNAKEHKVAFSLYPPAIDDIMFIADAEQFLPHKSTWLEPKLRSGLFIHTLG